MVNVTNSPVMSTHPIYANRCISYEGNIAYADELEKDFICSYPEGKIASSCERHHQDLLEVFGGSEESSGNEYFTSSDEENINTV